MKLIWALSFGMILSQSGYASDSLHDSFRSWITDEAVKEVACPFPKTDTKLVDDFNNFKRAYIEFERNLKLIQTSLELYDDLNKSKTLYPYFVRLDGARYALFTEIRKIDLNGDQKIETQKESFCVTANLVTFLNQKRATITLILNAINEHSSDDFTQKEIGIYKNVHSKSSATKTAFFFQNLLDRTAPKAFLNDLLYMSYFKEKRLISRQDLRDGKKFLKAIKKLNKQIGKNNRQKIKDLSKDQKDLIESYELQTSSDRKLDHGFNVNLKRHFLDSLIVMGNLTWGLPNSLVGVGYIGIATVKAMFTDEKDMPRLRFSRNGKQITVYAGGFLVKGLAEAVSLGVIQITTETSEKHSAHEGGHTLQSALLGPAYIPYVINQYINSWGVRRPKVEVEADHVGDILPGRLSLAELKGDIYY